MTLQPIDWADLSAAITPTAIVLFATLGILFGALIFAETEMPSRVAPLGLFLAGTVFFLPYSLLRNLDGVPTWDRNLGAYLLWLVFDSAILAGTVARRRMA